MSDDYTAQPLARPGWSGERQRDLAHRGYASERPRTRRTVRDAASVLGLPVAALSEPVQQALLGLMEDMDALRWDLDQARHRMEWLEEQADRDPLLPLLNRRALLRELAQILDRGVLAETPGVLVLLHLRTLEAIRREFGLEAADQALRLAADEIIGALRQTDLAAHLDGGGFLLYLSLATHEGADQKARALIRRLEALRFSWDGHPRSLTVGLGLAEARDGDTPDALLLRADRALRLALSDNRSGP